jgi:hypothetical protein
MSFRIAWSTEKFDLNEFGLVRHGNPATWIDARETERRRSIDLYQ